MKKIISLNGKWKWKAEDEDGYHDGKVPGSVLADMLQLGMVPDPYWRCNEYSTRELFMKPYLYSRDFQVETHELEADEILLVCEGLDTIAHISLNGKKIASVNDMHRSYRFPVKSYLKAGVNRIEIRFDSSLVFVRDADRRSDIFYASTGSVHGNGYLRKAHYMFGWDWGPQLPDSGIFRDIYLLCSDTARLEDVRVRQDHGSRVRISIEAAVKAFRQEELSLEAEIVTPKGEVLRQTHPCTDTTSFNFEISSPQLWWPNGLGEHPLYRVGITLRRGSEELDSWQKKIGLRTLTVSTAPDEWGNEFAFVVNGVKVFAMGANYIPQDNLLSRITPKRTKRLVRDCERANFNCLRVWGGGYYPDDDFYDACDESGIIVWQDLMFACNVYELTGDFEQNILAETRDNVKRLRHHACMGLWCGNNEMEWGWADEWERLKGHHPRYKADYTKIFDFLLPREVSNCDDQTFFWPSSPSSGGSFDAPNDDDRGDKHYWDVWHSGKPFTEYRKHYFRFCSEYGFQSFPHEKTICTYTLPEDRNIFSEVMESHQKNGVANSKIFTYVADYFQYPKNLSSIAYISQVLQLMAVQYGVEHWRRNRGRCMGSLYWQLNDCWPVASWASIDYFGRWKALHYGAKRFYSPLAASAKEKEELSTEIAYFVHNDTMEEKDCTLEVTLLDSDLQELFSAQMPVKAAPLQAKEQYAVDFAPYILNETSRREVFARFRLLCGGETVSSGVNLFVKPKHFHFAKAAYRTEVRDCGDSFEIHVSASSFSYFTELYLRNADCVFSDNFFHITSPDGVTVTVQKEDLSKPMDVAELLSELAVRSVADSYETEGSDEA